MASGIISLGTKSNLRGQIVWSSVSNGSAANTSTVTAELQARKTSNTTIATEGNWTGSLNIGGTSKSFTKLKGVNSNAWVTLYSFSVTVSHDSTGAGTCYIYGKIKGPTGTTLAGYSVSGSETVALDDIPRFATLTAAPNFNDEQDPTIGFSNPAGSNAASVEACISLDGEKADVAYKSLGNATSGSYTFSLTPGDREVLLKATTKNSRTVYFIIRTVIGGSTGEIKYPVTFTVKDPMPEITPNIQDVNEKTKDLTGDSNKLVRYFSNAQITIGAQAQKESAITSQKVTNGSKSLTADGTIQAVESASFTFSATDSRRNTTKKTVTQEFVSYIKPTCQLANNIPDAEGAMTVKATGNCFNGSFGAKSNSLTVRYRYKVSGGSYGEWAEMTVALSGNTYTATAALTGLDYQTAYVFQTEAKDELTNVYSAEKTVKATPIFDWGEKDFQFHVPVLDQYSTKISNGVAQYSTEQIDPNTTLEELILTSHANGPRGSSWAFYIRTIFDSRKSTTQGRAQIAEPYGAAGGVYWRVYSSAGWSAWEKLANTADIADHRMKLLWENGDPTSTFAAQTFSVNGDAYDAYAVVAQASAKTDDRNMLPMVIGYKGNGGFLQGFPNNKIGRRKFAINSAGTSITFSATEYGNTYGGSTAENDYIVPMYIYGVYLN